MDKQTLRGIGLHFAGMAMFLLITGIVAEFYSLRASTPDPPFLYGTYYPYQIYVLPLLIAVAPTLLIGIFCFGKLGNRNTIKQTFLKVILSLNCCTKMLDDEKN